MKKIYSLYTFRNTNPFKKEYKPKDVGNLSKYLQFTEDNISPISCKINKYDTKNKSLHFIYKNKAENKIRNKKIINNKGLSLHINPVVIPVSTTPVKEDSKLIKNKKERRCISSRKRSIKTDVLNCNSYRNNKLVECKRNYKPKRKCRANKNIKYFRSYIILPHLSCQGRCNQNVKNKKNNSITSIHGCKCIVSEPVMEHQIKSGTSKSDHNIFSLRKKIDTCFDVERINEINKNTTSRSCSCKLAGTNKPQKNIACNSLKTSDKPSCHRKKCSELTTLIENITKYMLSIVIALIWVPCFILIFPCWMLLCPLKTVDSIKSCVTKYRCLNKSKQNKPTHGKFFKILRTPLSVLYKRLSKNFGKIFFKQKIHCRKQRTTQKYTIYADENGKWLIRKRPSKTKFNRKRSPNYHDSVCYRQCIPNSKIKCIKFNDDNRKKSCYNECKRSGREKIRLIKTGDHKCHSSHSFPTVKYIPKKKVLRIGSTKKKCWCKLKRIKKYICNLLETEDASCRELFLKTLPRRRYFWIYKKCPSCYPHVLYILRIWRQLFHCLLFILATVVWCPAILCFIICEQLFCCIM